MCLLLTLARRVSSTLATSGWLLDHRRITKVTFVQIHCLIQVFGNAVGRKQDAYFLHDDVLRAPHIVYIGKGLIGRGQKSSQPHSSSKTSMRASGYTPRLAASKYLLLMSGKCSTWCINDVELIHMKMAVKFYCWPAK